MNWLIGVIPAVWAIWTWAHEREKERMATRQRMVALYVYPFLSACEDLQSRIYNILALNGLRVLRKRYPDASYADETLYLIVRYFGWVAAMHRYGTHSQDPEVVHLTEAVHNAFATPQYPLGAFNFSGPSRKPWANWSYTVSKASMALSWIPFPIIPFKNSFPCLPWRKVRPSNRPLRR